jgi:uncharacterized protein YbjT (DUF2867 family)
MSPLHRDEREAAMNILLLGATGAVGAEVLKALVIMPNVTNILVLARRKPEPSLDPKVTWHSVDVMDPKSYRHLLGNHDAAICTMGVGQPSKVSREEFVKVDKDAVEAFAVCCKTAGVKHFELLGSVAVDPTSRWFYLKTKGELRQAIANMGFARFSIFQPSMLLTPSNRYGVSQGITLALWPLLSPLLVGRLNRYRGIRVETLGLAMANNLFTSGSGTEILHWPEFMNALPKSRRIVAPH